MFFLNAKRYTLNAGVSLVEVVIGTALILISLVGLVTAFSFYLKVGLTNSDGAKASFLLQEGVESVTLLRDSGWSNLSALTSGAWYSLSWNGSSWNATTTEELIDSTFKRSFKLDEVYRRNADKDIVGVTSGEAKSLDPNTKKLTVRVTASSSNPVNIEVETYLTNLFE